MRPRAADRRNLPAAGRSAVAEDQNFVTVAVDQKDVAARADGYAMRVVDRRQLERPHELAVRGKDRDHGQACRIDVAIEADEGVEAVVDGDLDRTVRPHHPGAGDITQQIPCQRRGGGPRRAGTSRLTRVRVKAKAPPKNPVDFSDSPGRSHASHRRPLKSPGFWTNGIPGMESRLSICFPRAS